MNNFMDNISKINKLENEIKRVLILKHELDYKNHRRGCFVLLLMLLIFVPTGYYSLVLFEYVNPESAFFKAVLSVSLLFLTAFSPFSILFLFEHFNIFGEEKGLEEKIENELLLLKKEKENTIKGLNTNEISKIENDFNKALFEQCIDVIEEDQEGMSIEKCAIEKLRLEMSDKVHDPKKREVVKFLEEYDKEVQRIKEIRKNDRLNKIKEKKNMHDLVND